MRARSAFGLLLIASAAASACSSGREPEKATPREPPVAPELPMPTTAQLARTFPAFAPEWAKSEIRRTARGFEHVARAGVSALHDGESMRLSVTADVWLRLRPLDRPSGLRVESGALVASSRLGTETWSARGGRVEQIRVVSGAGAVEDELTLGDGLASLRVRDGRIEALDDRGVLRIGSEPVFLVDARGARRAVTVTLEGEGARWRTKMSWDDRDLVPPLAIDPAWSAVGAMAYGRRKPAIVKLPSGKVFVAGGFSPTGATPKVPEIYDPTTNAWTSGASSASSLFEWAFLLPNGKVLAVSGWTAAVYDPAADAWQAVPLLGQQVGGSAAQAADGRVVLSGGRIAGVPQKTTRIFDGATNTWSVAADLSVARDNHHSFGLPDGRVLATGGQIEIYSPATNTWTPGPSLPGGSPSWPASAPLGTGLVAMGGGYYDAHVDVYDPVGASWTVLGSATHTGATLSPLPGGDVLVVGGEAAFAEVLFASTKTLVHAGSTAVQRWWPRSAALDDGRVLVVGGANSDSTVSYASAEIFQLGAKGARCADPGECASRSCVDGRCCDSACAGACQACDVPGVEGTCSAVVAGAPHGARSCAPYTTCAAGACATTCKSGGDCLGATWCDGSACQPKKAKGAACAAAEQCTSGFCVDDVCCDAACGGQCEACDVAGSVGACTQVLGAPRGGRPTCAGVLAGTTCGSQCTTASRATCGYAPPGVGCGVDGCAAGVETRASACDGAGRCGDVGKSCGAYACGGDACKGACVGAADCATGFTCEGTTCVPIRGLGVSCTADSFCATGHCVDGVCCASAACDAGSTCGGKSNKGLCSKRDGTTCAADGECGSGACVDGVCCEARCGEQCQACDVAGHLGECYPVKGLPHGARPACSTGEPCAGRACDGTVTKTCEAVPGSDVPCAEASCAAGVAALAATCDGKGACARFSASCGAYRCDAAGRACRAGCATDPDCADGYACSAGKCVRRPASCSDDLGSVVAADGTSESCAPYLCADGACKTECSTSVDCVAGTACSSGACVPTAQSAGEGGGCHASGRSSGGGGVLACFFVAAAALLRRRLIGLAIVGTAGCHEAEPRPNVTSGPGREVAVSTAFRGSLERQLGWTRAGGGFAAKTSGRAGALRARVDGALHLTIDGRDDLALDVLGDARAPRPQGAVVVADDESRHAHAVWLALPEGVEELRVLDDAEAPPRLRQRLRAGAGIAEIRLREGRIEAVEPSGRVAFGTAPAYAVDARGARVPVTVDLGREGGELVATFSVETRGLTFPVTIDPLWTVVASMSTPREFHDALLLASGKVLVAGGQTYTPTFAKLSTAELYDPALNTWTATGSTAAPPVGAGRTHLAKLGGGKVLLLAGYLSPHVYDPASGTWTAPSSKPKTDHGTLTALADGRALAVGGENVPYSTAEIFDPATSTWSDAAPMPAERYNHAAVRLPSGRVLVIGGSNDYGHLETAVEWDPATGKWSGFPSMNAFHTGHGAAVTSDGRVVVAGGVLPATTSASAGAELYDPVTAAWRKLGDLSAPRGWPAIARLPNDAVLVLGGASGLTPDVFVSAATTAQAVGTLAFAHQNAPLVVLADGRAIVPGGSAGNNGTNGSALTELLSLGVGGAACSSHGACASGFCVDGVCCERACDGACETCKATPGACTPVTGAPVGSPQRTATCAPYATCTAGACAATCATSSECLATHFCSSGACVPRRTNGASCADGRECASGQCVDRVCCASACAAQCQACDVPGSLGTCVNVTGDPHGARSACAAAKSACGLTCTGETSSCAFPEPFTRSCGVAACSSGVETHVDTCDGAGACRDVGKPCGAYACGPTACRSTCAGDGDCAAGNYCRAGVCVAREGLGAPCAADGNCGSLFCVEGVCCGVSSCGAGKTCAAPGALGSCIKVLGAACAAEAECASGHCVDGVCCDAACDGQCEACDVPGAFGRCRLVAGAPHGARAACADGGGEACGRRSCDGARRDACEGFVGPELVCREAACDGGGAIARATCDGTGTACPAAVRTDCGGYQCDPARSACRSTCTIDGDCLATYECVDGLCRARTARCSLDGSRVIEIDGAEGQRCEPFRCRAGACLETCVTTGDCAAGLTCDVGAGTCLLPEPIAAPASEGGCGVLPVSQGATARSGLGFAGLLACALVARRRRARGAPRRPASGSRAAR